MSNTLWYILCNLFINIFPALPQLKIPYFDERAPCSRANKKKSEFTIVLIFLITPQARDNFLLNCFRWGSYDNLLSNYVPKKIRLLTSSISSSNVD